jgi:hypothetical protein
MHHLLITCPFSRQVWHDALSSLRMTCQSPSKETSLDDWWQTAKRATPKPLRKGLASMTLLIAWMLWKQRNAGVFEGENPSANLLLSEIRKEAALWAKAGAKGLRVILPST